MNTDEGPSTSSDSAPLKNAVAVFLAHFHTRRGNEIVWQKGEADLAGVEWKVLPSGSHGVERDIIYFEAPPGPDGDPRIGVAAFRNTKLSKDDRSGVAENEGDDNQRGARMLAVGAILDCGRSSTPRSLLEATLPHIPRLEGLVDALSADPACRDLLEEWLAQHKEADDEESKKGDATAGSPLYAHDPLLQLPAITNALGPLLPSLLKRLILPRFRLLLYIPGGAPTFRAAGIAFALGELAHAACQFEQQTQQGCPASGSSMMQHGLQILGLIGLHDIARLQDEAKRADTERTSSWIAWTTDRILLEKCDMYDAALDLSPLTPADAYSADDFLATPTALPHLLSTYRSESKTGKRTAGLRKQNWSAREFATFRGIDEQASHHAASRKGRRRHALGRQASQSSTEETQLTAPPSPYLSPTRHLSQQGGAATFLALLRFWLANLWILPYHWRFNLRGSYGYVPLGIRSDGGVRASIMLLPDDDDESDISEDDTLQVEQQSGGPSSASNLSVPSTTLRRRHSGSDEQAISDDEDEDDPILAACGATQASSRQRRSRSRSSISRSAIQSVADVVANQTSIRDGARHVSGQDLVQGESDAVVQEARESFLLSRSIFELWSLWVRELVEGVQQLVQGKLAREGDDGYDGEDNNDGDSFPQRQENFLVITASDIAELRLSASNAVDVELIKYLASTISTRPLLIQRNWWSAAAAIWS